MFEVLRTTICHKGTSIHYFYITVRDSGRLNAIDDIATPKNVLFLKSKLLVFVNTMINHLPKKFMLLLNVECVHFIQNHRLVRSRNLLIMRL